MISLWNKMIRQRGKIYKTMKRVSLDIYIFGRHEGGFQGQGAFLQASANNRSPAAIVMHNSSLLAHMNSFTQLLHLRFTLSLRPYAQRQSSTPSFDASNPLVNICSRSNDMSGFTFIFIGLSPEFINHHLLTSVQTTSFALQCLRYKELVWLRLFYPDLVTEQSPQHIQTDLHTSRAHFASVLVRSLDIRALGAQIMADQLYTVY